MPKIVDHDAERQRLSAAACRSVARSGLEGATLRAIAEEARCSTGPLIHYFGDKNQILIHALRHASRETGMRMLEVLSREKGRAALRGMALEGLPIDDLRRAEWRVWLAFWGQAIVGADLAAEQNRRYTSWRRLMQSVFLQAQADGELSDRLDPEREAVLLVAFIDGIGLQAMFEPKRFDPQCQRDLLDGHLGRLLPSS